MKRMILLSAVLVIGAVSACSGGGGGGDVGSSAQPTAIDFAPLGIPNTDKEHVSYKVTDKLIVTYSDGSKKEYPLSYEVLLQSGDQIGNYKWGQLLDVNGQPMSNIAYTAGEISWNPDANSLIKTSDSKYFIITHFEEPPGMLYASELDPNTLKVKSITPIDFSSVGGTIINCAGSLTPWNTHLGGEEDYDLNSIYSVSAGGKNPAYVQCVKDSNGYFTGNDSNGKYNYFCGYVGGVQRYLKDLNIDPNNGYLGDRFNLYNYGYIVEVAYVNGKWEVAKHYITGKYTPEMAVVMPDRKTLYMTDDGDYKGLYKLVLNQPQNGFNKNWCGTLYAAKVKQLSDQNGGTFDVSWIQLGTACDSEVKAIIDKKPLLTDIFDVEDPSACPTDQGFKLITEDRINECLRLKVGQYRSSKFASDDEVKKAAAFLETRKYAAYLGASVEFRKGEGLAYDPDNNALYYAITEIGGSMADGKGDINLPKNMCGAVYRLVLDQNYNAYRMEGIVIGKEIKKDPNDPDYQKYGQKWACHPDYIANPDNLKYIGYNTLLIGEDTSLHINNFVWAYNVKTGRLTRIAWVPTGAEVTGVFAHGQVGNNYIMTLNIQHPFVDTFKNADGNPVNSTYNDQNKDKKKGILGIIKGIPAGLLKLTH
ncbi:PhoX family protein [Hydrogenobacter thermophilus]|uniref:PhoX family protein n=1 Tax=Hydrogenobacter thermophilus TaxID=940 RepID=UPI0030FCC540